MSLAPFFFFGKIGIGKIRFPIPYLRYFLLLDVPPISVNISERTSFTVLTNPSIVDTLTKSSQPTIPRIKLMAGSRSSPV